MIRLDKAKRDLGERSYPIYIKNDYKDIGRCIQNARLTGRIVLVTDSNVDKYQAQECIEALKSRVYGGQICHTGRRKQQKP